MAIALVLDLPGVTSEQYETARGILGSGRPAGNLVHTAGPTEDGWRVVEVWESPTAVEAFFASDVARRAFQAAGIAPAQPAVFPVHTLAAAAASA
jgi:hypothetical protein